MKILVGITGGIAAYKVPSIVSALKSNGHEVIVSMTEAAQWFVTPMSLATMSGSSVVTSLQKEIDGVVTHIALSQWCDIFAVVPCTANFIGKMAHGIADDALSTIHIALSTNKKKRICPAMNTNMYENPIVQRNIEILTDFGYDFLEPDSGKLACGDEGIGKLPSTRKVVEFIQADNMLEIL